MAETGGLRVGIGWDVHRLKAGLPLILATVFFSFQIFCDFSGYSDIALGSARVMGFTLMKNFDRPYASRSISEFWSRWHISLSTWFRDYLYIPLGGNRVSKPRLYANYLIVFAISGLWHGASWNFVVWGLFHGTFLVAERIRRPVHPLANDSRRSGFPVTTPRIVLGHVYTLLVVMVGWVFFRADTLTDAVAFLRAMAGMGIALPTPFAAAWYFTPELWLAFAAGVVARRLCCPGCRASRPKERCGR